MNSSHAAILISLSFMLASATAEARFFRSDQIPHGGTFDCGVCHLDGGGGMGLNPFGQTVFDNGLDVQDGTGNVDWNAICMMDSDGDGYTNGEELGDQNCQWTVGANDPSVDPTNPGLPGEIPCGNGVVDGPEDCDGTQLGGLTCVDLMPPLPAGPLSCNMNCTFNTSLCQGNSTNNANNTNNTNNANNTTGTNNTTGPTNNTNPNNANVNNGAGPDPDPSDGDDGEAPDVGAACDGTLEVDEGSEESAAAIFTLFLLIGGARRFGRG